MANVAAWRVRSGHIAPYRPRRRQAVDARHATQAVNADSATVAVIRRITLDPASIEPELRLTLISAALAGADPYSDERNPTS